MGLDVYLRKCANFEAVKAHEAAVDRQTDALYETLPEGYSQEQLHEVRAKVWAIREAEGLDEDGRSPDREDVCHTSITNPDHALFSVGYFRSSYNGGGINSVADRLGLPGLYDIFNPPDDYEFKPDWYVAEELAVQAVNAWREVRDAQKYDVVEVAAHLFDPEYGAHSSREALDFFERNANRKSSFREFSCKDGEFFLDGLKIFAAILGKSESFQLPCTYLIIEAAALDFYVQAMEIVLETIRFVLDRPDADDYFLVWSS